MTGIGNLDDFMAQMRQPVGGDDMSLGECLRQRDRIERTPGALDVEHLGELAELAEASGHDVAIDVRRGLIDFERLEAALRVDPELRRAAEELLGGRIEFGGASDGVIGVRPFAPERPSVEVSAADVARTAPRSLAAMRGPGPEAYRALERARTEAPGPDFSFLDDPSLDMETKLMLFMSAILQSLDGKLTELMRRHDEALGRRPADGGGGDGAGGSSGLGGMIGSALGMIGGAIIGGPAGANIGGALGGLLGSGIEDIADGPSRDGGAAPGEGGAAQPSPETMLAEIQRLTQLRQQMVSLTTNILATGHQTNMAVINNLRG